MPKWLFDTLGPDYFGHIEFVHVGPRNIDEVIKQVGRLDQVRRLNFIRAIDFSPVAKAGLDVSPTAGLSHFRGLMGLITTDLSPPPIQGASLKYLKNLTHLENLGLPQDTSVTDADLAYLSRLAALRQLNLHDPRITDSGLVAVKNLTALTVLRLSGTHVTTAGLKNVRAMTSLKFLDLARTLVNDIEPIRG